MLKLKYIYAKVLKKLRCSAIRSSQIHATSKIESGSNVVNTTMGRYSFCGYDCDFNNVEIGSFVSIANGVVIGGEAHPIDWVSTSPVFYKGRDSVRAKFSTYEREISKKTIIGHDVWIGQNTLIKQGVVIGTGAVIGMGSVVTKDVPPYSVFAGNPAKLIKMRFEDRLIERLLESEWWNSEKGELTLYVKHILNPIEFLKHFEK